MGLPAEAKIISVIRENQRFATYRAEYAGQSVFLKQAKRPELANRVWRELWGLQTFAELAEVVDFPFALPQVVASGKDYIATTWIEGSHMSLSPISPNYQEAVEFFATSLAAIDRVTRPKYPIKPRFDTPGAPNQSLADSLRARLHDVSYGQYFDEMLIDRSFTYLDAHLQDLEAGFAHGDFTPQNVLQHRNKQTLVDFESCSLRWPRFYDLVNLTYNRMIMEPALTSSCVRLTKRYFEINEDLKLADCAPQLNTIAMVRSLSMINELMTEPDSYHNTKQEMTTELAERLRLCMQAILQGDVYLQADLTDGFAK